ncbi:MAG: glutamine-hydrolyzing GMP synthase, partial [Cyclobacteriaceae bacterium]|nr:glutamine-hydrolyzing GMP synthase [Cyclobacteriaceae bacterium]
MSEQILIIDFGSQYTQLIARRVRELNVYCEIHPYNHLPAEVKNIKGVILSGSPFSVREKDAPSIDLDEFSGKVPVLGVCYGAQLMVHNNKGVIAPSKIREYGRARLEKMDQHYDLLKEMTLGTQVWMSHGDTISELPSNFINIAGTEDVKNAAFKLENEDTYGIQFHPEVTHSKEGKILLRNFVVHICGCKQDWTPDIFVESTVANLKKNLGKDKVVLGLSGGVDSSVAAMLIHRAIGKNLYCIFVDNGLLRKNEKVDLETNLTSNLDMNIKFVDAREKFLNALKEVSDPEKKRKIIGNLFIEVFESEASKIENAQFLGQGTLYPDIIESKSAFGGPTSIIKSHHNVGGLPEKMKLDLIEPLDLLFKDEVRKLGLSLGLDENLVFRQPFPGPG